MMENNNTITLFQNGIELEINLPEPEEIEAAEDEKRRNDELKEMMLNAFDDLDDSHSVDNSYYDSSHGCDTNLHRLSKSQKHTHNETPTNIPKHSPRYSSPGYDNYQQLEVLYQVRLREIDKLHDDMKSFKEAANREKSQLIDKITALETEKQNALTSSQEYQRTLMETRRRLSDYESELKEIKQKLNETESQKNKAVHKLQMCEDTNREIEQRLILLEKNTYKSEQQNFDIQLKDISSKHKRQVADLQREINSLSKKLTEKENECVKYEHQLRDLQRMHESMLVEKTEIINKLTLNLKESQSQCQNLISNSSHDNVKLMNQIKSQKAELNSLSIQITALKKEKNQLLDQLQKSKSGKNEENKSHQDQIHQVEAKIQELMLENQTLKESVSKNESCNTSDPKEEFFKRLEGTITSDIIEKISKLESELEKNLKECDGVKKLYIEVCAEKDSLAKENFTLKKNLNDLKEEENRLKKLIENISHEKEELSRAFESLKQEFTNQKKQLEEMKTRHEEELRLNSDNHIRQMDDLKLALKNEFSKIEVFHQDQISKMELECSKKILEMQTITNTRISQIEANVREEAMRICAEEVKNLSHSYKTELENVQMQHNAVVEELNKKTEEIVAQCVDLRSQLSEVYDKYKKTRNTAIALKETLDQRNRYINERNNQFVTLMNEIQNQLNYALDFKFTDGEKDKSAQVDLIDENNSNSSILEFKSIINSMNQKFSFLRAKHSDQMS